MGNLAQLDLRAKGAEARVRALLEDLVFYYKGIYPGHQLALLVWFGKSSSNLEHNLLALFTGLPMDRIVISPGQSLAWKTGSNEPPFANIHATSVDYFASQIDSNRQGLVQYFDRFEVLYFDKNALKNENVLRAFNVITEPSGLVKGWYISAHEYAESQTIRRTLALYGHTRPYIGLVTTEESADFENRRGLLHTEVEQRWLPLPPGALHNYTFYTDLEGGQAGYFLFEGGALYRILKFEVKTAPEYDDRVLEKPRDDRYAEVYLRAVHPPEQPAA